MKRVASHLIFALCLIAAGPAFAQSANTYEHTTKYAAKVDPPTAPLTCKAGEVLAYNGQSYACVKNFTDVTCPNGQALRVISADGTPTCEPVFIAMDCPADHVLQSFDPSTGAKTCVKPAPPGPVPDCGGAPLTSNGVNLSCKPRLYEILGGLSEATMHAAHPGCNQANLAAHGLNFEPHPDATDSWGAFCVSACNRHCKNNGFSGGLVLGANYYTPHWDCLCIY